MKKTSKYIAVIIGIALFLLFSTAIFLNNRKDSSQYSATNNKLSMIKEDNSEDYDFTIHSNADYIAIKPDDLYKNADLVIIANYNCDNKNYIGNNQSIITEASFDVQKVIKGEYKNNKININYYGGSVPLSDYIKCLSSEQMKKRGLDTLTEEETHKGRVTQVVDKSQIEAKKDENYLIFLSYDKENDIYFVLADGYGMRKLSEDNKIFNSDTNSYDMSLDNLNM